MKENAAIICKACRGTDGVGLTWSPKSAIPGYKQIPGGEVIYVTEFCNNCPKQEAS